MLPRTSTALCPKYATALFTSPAAEGPTPSLLTTPPWKSPWCDSSAHLQLGLGVACEGCVTDRQVATIPLLKHKAGDDEAYRQQQQSAWEAQQHVHRPSTSHPTNMSAAAHRPPRPASVAAVYGGGGGGGGSSSRGWESGATFGGTDGIKWGGPTSGVDESLLLPSCAPAPPRPHSSIGHGGAGAEGGGASAAASARKPSPLGSPVAQQVRRQHCIVCLMCCCCFSWRFE